MTGLLRTVIVLIVCTGVLPLLTGMILWKNRKGWAERMVFGVLTMAALFEICCVPMTVLHRPLHMVSWLCLIVWAVLLGAAWYRNRQREKIDGSENLLREQNARSGSLSWTEFCPDRLCLFLLILVTALVLLQCGMYIAGQHIDDDDARYVANAAAACETDTLYRFHPNTGEELTYYPGEISKDVVSTVTMMYAAVSQAAGSHPTILIHTFWPVYWLLIHVLVLWMLAGRLYKERWEQFVFLAVCLGVQVMGNVSVYTGSSFTLLRLWQGKALIPAILVPLGICLLEDIGKTSFGAWCQAMVLSNVFACFCSGNGIYLSAVLTGILCLCGGIIRKEWKYLAVLPVLLVPNLILTVVYELAVHMIIV